MPLRTELAATAARIAPAVGRFALALIFVLSGWAKMTGPDAAIASIAGAGFPAPAIMMWLAVLTELGGGLLLIVGWQARLVALLLAGFSLVTALAFHADIADEAQLIHLLKNVAIAGGLLQVVAFGAGPLSLDSRGR